MQHDYKQVTLSNRLGLRADLLGISLITLEIGAPTGERTRASRTNAGANCARHAPRSEQYLLWGTLEQSFIPLSPESPWIISSMQASPALNAAA